VRVIIHWFILLPPDSIKNPCKLAEDSYKDILFGSQQRQSYFDNDPSNGLMMIGKMKNWEKNPNMQFNTTLMDFMRREYIKAKQQPSKISNFKTKSLNMWVEDNVWIPSDIWKQNDINFGAIVLAALKVDLENFKVCSYAGG
jgi:phage terminase large subunit-like protein